MWLTPHKSGTPQANDRSFSFNLEFMEKRPEVHRSHSEVACSSRKLCDRRSCVSIATGLTCRNARPFCHASLLREATGVDDSSIHVRPHNCGQSLSGGMFPVSRTMGRQSPSTCGTDGHGRWCRFDLSSE